MTETATREHLEAAAMRERLESLEAVASSSLELLEAGRSQEARRLLAESVGQATGVAGAPPPSPSDAVSDSELEAAFEAAEPEVERS